MFIVYTEFTLRKDKVENKTNQAQCYKYVNDTF